MGRRTAGLACLVAARRVSQCRLRRKMVLPMSPIFPVSFPISDLQPLRINGLTVPSANSRSSHGRHRLFCRVFALATFAGSTRSIPFSGWLSPQISPGRVVLLRPCEASLVESRQVRTSIDLLRYSTFGWFLRENQPQIPTVHMRLHSFSTQR